MSPGTCQERFASLRDGLRPHLTEPVRLLPDTDQAPRWVADGDGMTSRAGGALSLVTLGVPVIDEANMAYTRQAGRSARADSDPG
jgi:hypothetical protein